MRRISLISSAIFYDVVSYKKKYGTIVLIAFTMDRVTLQYFYRDLWALPSAGSC